MLSFEEVQVGQEIGVHTSPGYDHGYSIQTVVKKTKTQITLNSGRKFNKYLSELKSPVTSYPKARLLEASTVYGIEDRKNGNHKTNKSVKAVLDVLNGHKNGMGQFCISEATKAELLAAVQNLHVNCEV